MAPGLQAFDHVHIFVADRSAAEVWYQEVLGFEVVSELEFWAANGGPLTLKDGSGSIHLALFERDVKPCRSTVALRTSADQYRRWKQHLSSLLPGRVTEENHDLSMSLYFSDPDGNPFEITTYELVALRQSSAA
jgi:catechol-2,3-dioxygenase